MKLYYYIIIIKFYYCIIIITLKRSNYDHTNVAFVSQSARIFTSCDTMLSRIFPALRGMSVSRRYLALIPMECGR